LCFHERGNDVSTRKALAIVNQTRGNVSKIPGPIAFDELLERITDRGVEVDAGSKLSALDDPRESRLLARANRPELVAGQNGAARRRRGAPMPKPGR
jgi:hypothetical protein